MAVRAVASGRAGELGPSSRRWAAFAAIALAIVVADQLSKAFVAATFPIGSTTAVIGDLVRIAPGPNTGAIFGLFKDQAWIFAILSVGVLALIVAYHGRSADAGPIMSVTLGLLLGGAIGNLIDRFRLGYVLDFVDVGVGGFRWYTFNIADAAISTSIVLLVVASFLGPRLPGGARR
jgi:signal peptidase II